MFQLATPEKHATCAAIDSNPSTPSKEFLRTNYSSASAEHTFGKLATSPETAATPSTTATVKKPVAELAAEGEGGPVALEHLLSQQYGFARRDLTLLRENGFATVECIAYAPQRALLSIKGFSEQKCEKLKHAAKQLVGLGFCSASEFLEARENMIRFTTGSVQLDRLLAGGIETGNLTELFGEFRTGKTQLCHTLAVTCQLPIEKQGGEGKCLWIDTEGTFRPERIQDIARRFELDEKDVLGNIVYARAFNTEHQLELLVEAAALMVDSRFALLIMDSVTSLFRSEYIGRSELAARQGSLLRVLRVLQRLSDVFGVAVVVTNQVCAKVDVAPMFGGAEKIPIGGHIMAHSTQTRLALRKGAVLSSVLQSHLQERERPDFARCMIVQVFQRARQPLHSLVAASWMFLQLDIKTLHAYFAAAVMGGKWILLSLLIVSAAWSTLGVRILGFGKKKLKAGTILNDDPSCTDYGERLDPTADT